MILSCLSWKRKNCMNHGFTTTLHYCLYWYEAFKVHHKRWSPLFFFHKPFTELYSKLKKKGIIISFFISFALQFWFSFKSDSFCRFLAWMKCDYNEIEFFPLNLYTAINLSIQWIYPANKSIECNLIDAHNIIFFPTWKEEEKNANT